MEDCINEWKQLLQSKPKRHIAFAEPFDLRVLKAATALAEEQLLTPVLLGNQDDIIHFAKENNVTMDNCTYIDPAKQTMTQNEATTIADVNLLGTLLVKTGKVDGLLTGAVYATKDAIRPALQHIPLKRENSRISGVMVVSTSERRLLFADCSTHIEPSAHELFAIAMETIETAKSLAIEPRVAFVSYTSASSRTDETVLRIKHAIELTKAAYPTITVDGELQFDAAYNPQIARKKVPNSPVQGDASIFIFPTLEAGNIACKIIEHLTSCQTFGPITQGFTRPIHDLSRGCTTKTIYDLAIFAAVQAIQ